MTNFTTELHLHTCFSFLEGASRPEELVARATQLGYTALAVTDHDGLHGAMEFAQACVAVGLQPITGVELTLRHGLVDASLEPVHLTLLAENRRGYGNLCRLITEAWRGTREWDGGGWWSAAMEREGDAGTRRRGEEREGRASVLTRAGMEARPTGHAVPGGRRLSVVGRLPVGQPVPPSLDPSFLDGHTEGIIALSGCRSGEVAQLVDAGRFGDALAAAQRLAELFGWDSTFIELQHNLVQGDTRRVARLAELAQALGVETAATGNVHYHERARHRLQDAMVAVKHRTTLEASHRLRRPNSEFYLRSPEETAEIFAAYPRAVANTVAIAERCADFNLAEPGRLGYEFPDFSRQASEQGVSADEALAAYCWARFEERYGTADCRPPAAADEGDVFIGWLPSSCFDRLSTSEGAGAHPEPVGGLSTSVGEPARPEPVEGRDSDKPAAGLPGGRRSAVGSQADPKLLEDARKQLTEELRLVAKHRLAGFFLLYRDLQELATRVAQEVRGAGTVRGGSGLPPGRGRGSSVSSIICYLIGLSHVDPVKNRLFFKRFLNEDLRTVPDIDLDFARDIREQLILQVYERYGHEHAALVCSLATYHLRSAVRDMGKVLGLPPAAIDKLAKLSEGGGTDTVRRELERLPELQGQARGPLWQHLVELCEQLKGFPRHVGQHVGGMIISSSPLVEVAPVQPSAMPGRYICQWDKDGCDDARFIKIDFLALGMLSLVEECLELIWQTRGEKVDLSGIAHDDPAVYDAICVGDTVGMFQIESRAQIQMLPRTQPRNLDDLAVQVAIVRPGPIVGGAVNPYVRRREQSRLDPTYQPQADHPRLNKLLADTLGVVLYQDQVLEVAMAIGSFTAGQADSFRRAMSRRRSREAMESFRTSFLEGARKLGDVSDRDAQAIFDKLCAFSEFGFPKSHAYAFAVLAYQSAWLRYYYPAEYFAALLNNQPMGFYSPHVLVGDARRHGIRVLRVSINRSGVRAMPVAQGLVPRSAETGLPVGRASLPAAGGGPRYPESVPAGAEAWATRGDALTLTLSQGEREGMGALSQREREGEKPPAHEGGYILLGLSSIKGMSEDLASAIVAEREANGSYRSLPDLLRRVSLPRLVAERLIAVGALSEFGLGRRELLWQMGLLVTRSKVESRKSKVQSSAKTLDFRLWTFDFVSQDMVRLRDMNDWERMVADYHLLELSPSYHPLGMVRPLLPEDVRTAEGLRQLWDGARVRTAGMVVCRQRPGTAKGFVFLLVEDETGLTNVVIRPDLYEAERSVVRGAPYLVVEGRLQLRSGTLNLLAERVTPLSAVIGESLEATAPGEPQQPRRPAVKPPATMPRPALRHGSPGNLHDPREAAAAQSTSGKQGGLESLPLATPASHDFH